MSLERGGGRTEGKKKEEKFPLCVKALVIGPFEVAAKKKEKRNKLKRKKKY